MINEIWTGPELKQKWKDWIEFRKENKWKKYVPSGERAAITELTHLAGHDEKKAIAIIQQSMVGPWKGFWPLNEKNANTNNSGRAQSGQDELYDRLHRGLSQLNGQG